MDGSLFDDLTRRLAASGDRRRFVRGLAAGLGGALGLATLRGGAAKPDHAGKPTGRCPDGRTNCRGTCVDLSDNPQHCGLCANVCSPGTACCGGTCVDLQDDPANCGACGTVCAPGEACVTGACACEPFECGEDAFCDRDTLRCMPCRPAGGSCSVGGGTISGEACCGGICADTCRDACSPDDPTSCPDSVTCCSFGTPGGVFAFCKFEEGDC